MTVSSARGVAAAAAAAASDATQPKHTPHSSNLFKPLDTAHSFLVVSGSRGVRGWQRQRMGATTTAALRRGCPATRLLVF